METNYSERLPSMDTRPPRLRDSDAIIEVNGQSSPLEPASLVLMHILTTFFQYNLL